MLLLVVWIAVAVLAVLVLGALAYLTLGAAQRLRREVAGLDREVRPVLAQLQQTAARAGDTRNMAGGGTPGSGAGMVTSRRNIAVDRSPLEDPMNLGAPEIILIILAVLLLFGYKKLPDASRSFGRSLRIFKGEMKGMKDDDVRGKNAATATPVREVAPPVGAAPSTVDPTAQAEAEAAAAEARAAELRARADQARAADGRL